MQFTGISVCCLVYRHMGTQMLNIHSQALLSFSVVCVSHTCTPPHTPASSLSVFLPNQRCTGAGLNCMPRTMGILETYIACLSGHSWAVSLSACLLVSTFLCIWLFLFKLFTFCLFIMTINLPILYNLLACVTLRCPLFSACLATPPIRRLFLSVFLLAHPPPLLSSVPSSLLSIPPTPPPTRHENGAPLGAPGLSPVWHILLWSAVSWAKHPTKPPVWGSIVGKEERRGVACLEEAKVAGIRGKFDQGDKNLCTRKEKHNSVN